MCIARRQASRDPFEDRYVIVSFSRCKSLVCFKDFGPLGVPEPVLRPYLLCSIDVRSQWCLLLCFTTLVKFPSRQKRLSSLVKCENCNLDLLLGLEPSLVVAPKQLSMFLVCSSAMLAGLLGVSLEPHAAFATKDPSINVSTCQLAPPVSLVKESVLTFVLTGSYVALQVEPGPVC